MPQYLLEHHHGAAHGCPFFGERMPKTVNTCLFQPSFVAIVPNGMVAAASCEQKVHNHPASIGGEDALTDIRLFQELPQFCVRVGLNGRFVCFWKGNFKMGDIPTFHKKAHQGFQVSGIRPHGNFIQIWVITQSNVELLHCLLIQGGNRCVRRDSFIDLLDRFLVVMNCSVPQISCFTVQDIFFESVA